MMGDVELGEQKEEITGTGQVTISGVRIMRYGDGRVYQVQSASPSSSSRSDLDVIQGEYKDGMECGKGTLKFPSGDKYAGSFKNGYMHGRGSYFVRPFDSRSLSQCSLAAPLL